MAGKKEIRALITLAGKIDPSLQAAMLKASGESLKLSKNIRKSAAKINAAGSVFKGSFLGTLTANAFSAVARGISGIASESIQLASDLNEVQNVVDTTFGESAKAINNWSKQALNAYGLSELQAKQYSGTMGAMLKSSGVANDDMLKMSKNLTALAGDMSSFYNLSHEEAFTKIRSGISGETEPLKQLGINMSVANLEAYALSKGIKVSWSQMDQASQTLLRYNYLMDVSKDSQGDFAKTQGEYANQQRLFHTNMKEIAATLASKLLPYLNKLYQKANDFIKDIDLDTGTYYAAIGFDALAGSIQWVGDNSNWLIPILAGVVGGIAAFKIINTVNGLMKAWEFTTKGLTVAQWALNVALKAGPIGWVATGIGILIAAGVALWKNWDWLKEKALQLFEPLNKLLQPIKSLFGFGCKKVDLQASIKSDAPQSATLPNGIKKYGFGGIATEPSIFGESGPEMAIPLQPTPRSFSLLNQTAKVLGFSGGSSIQVTYAPVVYGGNQAEIEPLLRQHKEEIRMMIEDILEGNRRVAFG